MTVRTEKRFCRLNRLVLLFLPAALLAGLLCGCRANPGGIIDYRQGLSGLTGRPLRQGDRFTGHIALKSDLKMLFPNADRKESELDLAYNVKSVDKQGRAVVEVTVVSLRASEHTMNLKFAYDSEDEAGAQKSAQAKENQQKKYVAVFSSLKGSKYVALVNVKNRTVELTEMSQALKDIACGVPNGDMFGGDQTKMLFNEGILKEYVWPALFAGDDADSTQAGTVLVPGAPTDKIQRIYTTAQGDNPETVPYRITQVPGKEQAAPDTGKTAKSSVKQFQIDSIQGEGSYTTAVGKPPVLKMQEKMFVKMKSSGKTGMGYAIEKTIEIKCGRN